MSSSLAIGDFSRATRLSIKTLRHYHRIGLLEPAHVDPASGHRRYGTDQIPTAQRPTARSRPTGRVVSRVTMEAGIRAQPSSGVESTPVG